MGKLAIAHYILTAEQESPLSSLKTGRVSVDDAIGSWLWPFFSIALAACEKGNVVSVFEKVTLINFNYDRTIEHFLYWALQQRAGVEADVARQTVARLRIIRPYGSIGNLDWQSHPFVHFGDTRQDFFAISNNIRTFTEQINEPALLDSIDDALESACNIVFLGFGFHQQNLALMTPGTGKSRSNLRNVIATVYGIDQRNFSAIHQKLSSSLGLHPTPLLAPLTSSQLLNDLRPMISMFAS